MTVERLMIIFPLPLEAPRDMYMLNSSVERMPWIILHDIVKSIWLSDIISHIPAQLVY